MKEQITSVHNQHVKDWRKLQTRRGRKKFGQYLLDGWHLVQEASQSNQQLVALIGTADELTQHEDIVARFQNVYEVTSEVIKHITETSSPQGIVAVAKLPNVREVPDAKQGAWLLLDRVQDPGNVGTMVRTADAAGFAGVVASNRTADFFNPKVVRSMQGSQFHLRLVVTDLKRWINDFKDAQHPVFGTQLNPQAKNFREVQPGNDFALVMGNEGQGMAAELLSQTTTNLYIPMRGNAESLNVAVSAGILMFQLNREK
ncbi:RNA methyltransferase [uncultured Limosilactobacillus sp.]|uniref:TrmH family RNA methyltransferase n=1 Tax=uncultured Limosilactobacillus sp. TaxID=2837629 RepID=UPI0025F765D6|nr:RNA methyltransferase [uncultured Limosilactobacillus sp.]